mgnify:FL=1
MANSTQQPEFAHLAEQMDAFLTDTKIPVIGYSVTLIKDGKIAYERSGGYRRYDEKDPSKCAPMDRDTRYRIASISKMFTCTAIMQQVELGRMSLDGDASEYLGFPLRNPHYPDVVITPRLLMAHYGSIRDGNAYSIPKDVPISECFLPGGRYYGEAEHFAAPDGVHNMAPGGGYYVYSNLNYGLLGTMIERLSGERFDRYMRKHVFEPLGAQASFNPGDFDKEQINHLAAIYKRCKNGIWAVDQPWTAQMDDYQGEVQDPNVVLISNPDLGLANYEENVSDYRIGTNGTIFSPQGGARISAHELALFGMMLLNKGVAANGNRIISEESVKQLCTPVWVDDPVLENRCQTDSTHAYGAGISIISTEIGGDHMVPERDDITLFGHTGSAYGLISACFIDPARKAGFAYAFNGLGADQETHRGEKTHRAIWQERMMEIINQALFQ